MTTSRPICPNGHKPEYFWIPLYEMVDGELLPREEMVLMYPNGTLTNRYWDGTAGLSAEDRSEAEESETAFCGECQSDCNWKHGA